MEALYVYAEAAKQPIICAKHIKKRKLKANIGSVVTRSAGPVPPPLIFDINVQKQL